MPKGIYNRPTELERFWHKVDKTNNCWNWLGSKDKDGYGWFSLTKNGKTTYAHRYSALIKFTDLQDKLVRHTCDNTACVNPDHLILGTAKDNSNDMINRNRSLKGELNPNSKATNEQAKNILLEYEQATIKYGILVYLAKKYNLSKQIVYRITSKQRISTTI
tara:strand:+ start:417 stop:902 length:486 start_codon:yes stop_codon:yes gene_type:complete